MCLRGANGRIRPEPEQSTVLDCPVCRRGESNPLPIAYETIALPMSYSGLLADIIILNLMGKPDLSIIIVSYNTKKITENCIKSVVKSLRNSKLLYEIIVVDNGSTDGTVERFRNLDLGFKNLKFIENKENLGFGKANNQGAKIAKADCILFLNSDTVILDNAIERLFNFFKQNANNIHFTGAKLFNKDMTPQPSCGPFYTLPVVFGALFLRGDYWGLTRYSPRNVKEVDWISGACIMTKKDHFQKVGGFDEGIFMYMEEIDLFHRAKKLGFRVFFYPDSHIIHLGSASSGGKTYPIIQVYRGFLYLYKKNRSKLAVFLLKRMLQLKAIIALAIGKATKNKYLIETYEKAYQLTKMDR